MKVLDVGQYHKNDDFLGKNRQKSAETLTGTGADEVKAPGPGWRLRRDEVAPAPGT